MRDRLVCGISNQAIQKALLSEKNLTFKSWHRVTNQLQKMLSRYWILVAWLCRKYTDWIIQQHNRVSATDVGNLDIDRKIVNSDTQHAIAVERLDILNLFVEVDCQHSQIVSSIVVQPIPFLVHRIVRLNARRHRLILVHHRPTCNRSLKSLMKNFLYEKIAIYSN